MYEYHIPSFLHYENLPISGTRTSISESTQRVLEATLNPKPKAKHTWDPRSGIHQVFFANSQLLLVQTSEVSLRTLNPKP